MRKSKQEGYVVSIVTFFVLIIMFSIAVSMSSLIFYRQKISTNVANSTQSYYTAESGVEDALIRLRNSPEMASTSYSLIINGTTATVTIPDMIGGTRAITSQGNANGIIRNIQAVYSVDSQGISFHYGAQIGAGGLQMSNGSEIQGNVFSDGNITGSGTIDNNVIVAGNGNSIKDVYVGGSVLAYSCLAPANVGSLTYVTGGSHTCTVRGTTASQSSEIATQPLPIPQSQIDTWKSDATNGGVITGSYSIGNSQTKSLGPVKITGDLSFGNGATLNIIGTIYVQGNISFGNTDTIKLDSSYGSLGGVLLLDGTVSTGNGSVFIGSGQAGSYLLILSTSTADSAISVSNNVTGAIFYTSAGGISVSNNVKVKELTGYKVSLSNNATVQYDSGLESTFFSSGPSGGWKVTSWQEK